jgi:hypothetical protein
MYSTTLQERETCGDISVISLKKEVWALKSTAVIHIVEIFSFLLIYKINDELAHQSSMH